ncbi:MAG TPA: PHB depolymerase family esterase [Burkholderiaceae bacterium]|nr:PHB depolymerase family esterase [Burkholderiaceae bacterium]
MSDLNRSGAPGLRLIALLLIGTVSARAQSAPALPSYNVDPRQVSVSGLSSGGFFASQLGIGFSSVFKGVGIFAGGTYDCAGQTNYTGCMYNATPGITQSIANIKNWSGNRIDDISNIANQRIYLFTGTNDSTVGPHVTDQVYQLYVGTGQLVAAANVKYDNTNSAVHTFPTDFNGSGDNACNISVSPYISNCSFDGAGAALQWIHGTLNARNNGTLGGSLAQFDQTEFIAAGHGMDSTGWLYVPADCAAGKQCRLHVALHGCLQGYATIGADFLNNTGYNRWADTNDILVLYPQAVADNTAHATAASGSLPNPNGCWDWIGWYGADFDQKTGVQVKAIMAMVDRILAGQSSGSGGGAPPAPINVGVTGTTSSSITIGWTASAGATSYKVYRDDGTVQSSTATSFTDSGLAPATTHSYSVSALNSAGESARSAPVTTTTAGTVPYSQKVTATVLAHYVAGRLTVGQYLQLGQEYGYLTNITLYLCGSTWTNSPTCGPLH